MVTIPVRIGFKDASAPSTMHPCAVDYDPTQYLGSARHYLAPRLPEPEGKASADGAAAGSRPGRA